jgi:hypothetical protein
MLAVLAAWRHHLKVHIEGRRTTAVPCNNVYTLYPRRVDIQHKRNIPDKSFLFEKVVDTNI